MANGGLLQPGIDVCPVHDLSYDEWGDCAACDEPEPCPMGCGRTTDDVAGGPCTACWELAPRATDG
jgi:hypothetical protein